RRRDGIGRAAGWRGADGRVVRRADRRRAGRRGDAVRGAAGRLRAGGGAAPGGALHGAAGRGGGWGVAPPGPWGGGAAAGGAVGAARSAVGPASPRREAGGSAADALALASRCGLAGLALPEATDPLRLQFLDQLRDERGVALLQQVVDPRLRHLQLLHRRRRVLPRLVELLALGQVQLAGQLRQPLQRQRLLAVVVALA